MFTMRAPVIAFTIFLICSQVSVIFVITVCDTLETVSVILGQIQIEYHILIVPRNKKQVSADEPSKDEEERIQGLLLKILTAGLQESRYAVFENTIKEYHKDCFDRVYKIISDSTKSNKLEQLERLETLYNAHIKDYPKQNRQSILDNQIPEPISRNAGIATNALCHQMYGFTL